MHMRSGSLCTLGSRSTAWARRIRRVLRVLRVTGAPFLPWAFYVSDRVPTATVFRMQDDAGAQRNSVIEIDRMVVDQTRTSIGDRQTDGAGIIGPVDP